MKYEDLGRRVRQQRILAQLTQEKLAEQAGISLSFLGHIERGTRKASLETVINIANALGVSADTLLQDSLDVMTKPLASDACLSEHSRSLLNDIVGVLREHDIGRV